MKSYGQFCSIARSLDLLGERWTLLVVRELLCGSRRFGDIQRGIPRVSRTMLSARLRELLDAGVIERPRGAHGPEYRLTAAGQELAAVVRELGTWGQRWLTRELHRDELDARVLLWDIQRRVRRDALPARPLVVALELTDVRGPAGRHYLLLRRSEVSLCASNPGFPEELRVRTDRRTLAGWWRGDLTFRQAVGAGLRLEGRREWVRAFPDWFERYMFAEVAAVAAVAPYPGKPAHAYGLPLRRRSKPRLASATSITSAGLLG
ncbi:MAG TPA: helix-turn-helix domain-containing protein [Methylomirabilota bacterium]|jgi:DNA-binding HxlR family transcriptional regulator|nr:helix-turn-helix domain-containing protein [Methylomirabilota bacterium]